MKRSPRPVLICQQCHEQFVSSHGKRGRERKFCSHGCSVAFRSRPIAELPPDQRDALVEALLDRAGGTGIPATPENVADRKRLGYVGRTPGERNSNEWYTPPQYVEAARKALAGIDLDPFSSVAANKRVKASRFYTEEDDAFQQDWEASTVWMNPPYSARLVADAVGMFMDRYKAGAFESGIFLVNNATETRWFQRALREANAVCFTNHRISFWTADDKKSSGNTRGQAFFLFGKKRYKGFKEQFGQFGYVARLR